MEMGSTDDSLVNGETMNSFFGMDCYEYLGKHNYLTSVFILFLFIYFAGSKKFGNFA